MKSEGFAFGLLLGGTLGHEIAGHLWPAPEELVPCVAHRRDDADQPACANFYLPDTFGQAHVGWQPHGLGAVVRKGE